jgi:hypothetical protein
VFTRAIALSLWLLWFGWLVAVPAAAQIERGELQIAVTDPAGLPIHATGTLLSEAPRTYRTFVTDDTGRFILERLAFGVYRLVIECEGFASHSEIVDIRSAVPLVLRVELGLARLDTQIVVSYERPLVDLNSTGVAYAISGPQIRDHLPAMPGRTLQDLIEAQPGWLMEANGVLHPRGSEYQTQFVVDGVPLDENRSPAFAPDLHDGDVRDVAVLTGTFPAEYGRKLGGVVEVTTGRDVEQGFHGTADVAGGSFGTATGSLSGGYGWTRRQLSASVSAARTSRYLDPPVIENFTNAGSLGGVRLAYDDRPTDTDRVHIIVHYRRNRFLVPNELVQQAAGQRQEQSGREMLGRAAWTRILSSRVVLNARGAIEQLTATLGSSADAIPIIVSQDRAFTRGFVNAAVEAGLRGHQFKMGGDAVVAPIREQLDYRITAPAFFDEGTRPEFHFFDRRRSRELSWFAQDTMRLGPWSVSAGLRWDRYALVVEDSAFSPRLGVAWSWPDADLVLRASYDRVFQTPAVENLLLASSPETADINRTAARLPVAPSRGDFVEGGATVGLWRTARLDVTAYRRHARDFADDDVFLNTGVSFPVAFASATISGVDTKITLPPRGGFSGLASYSFLKGTADLPIVGGLFLGARALEELEEEGQIPITQDQRHTLRAQARYSLSPRAWIGATLRYGSGLPVEVGEVADEQALREQYGDAILERVDLADGRVQANVSLDVGLGAALWRRNRQRLDLRAEVANAANRLNVINFAGLFSGTAVAPPRSATVRLQYEF